MFDAETEQGVAQAIIRSVLDFKRDPWPKVSDSAKDLVKRMLDPDSKKRLSAQEVLGELARNLMLAKQYFSLHLVFVCAILIHLRSLHI